MLFLSLNRFSAKKINGGVIVKKRAKNHSCTRFHRTFSARDYLRKYGGKLTSDARLIQAAEQILTSVRKEISGNPISLAAGAFYFVCKNGKIKVSKDEIGEAFHISGRTVYGNERRISRLMSTKGIKF